MAELVALKLVGREDGDKQRALEAALTQIDRAFGKGLVMKLGDKGKSEHAFRLCHDLGDAEWLAPDPVVPDRIDQVLRPDQHHQLAQVHLGDQDAAVAPKDGLGVLRERVQMPEVGMRDGPAVGVQPLHRGADRAVRRAPAEDQQLAVLGQELPGDGEIKELTGRPLAEEKRGAERGQAVFAKLERLPMPSVAIVNGYAFGGGHLALILAAVFALSSAAAFAARRRDGSPRR